MIFIALITIPLKVKVLKNKTMSIVITGSTGHIGNNIARYLAKNNLDIVLLVRRIDKSIEIGNQPISIFFYDLFHSGIVTA